MCINPKEILKENFIFCVVEVILKLTIISLNQQLQIVHKILKHFQNDFGI